jgi:hypothetical protein
VVAVLAAVLSGSERIGAQSGGTDSAALRARIERRFEVLPLRDGVALRPRDASRTVRSVEVTSGLIAIDGQPATGAEVRDKLGADADLILQLSYLSDTERRAVFSDTRDVAPAPIEPRVAEPTTRRQRRVSRDGDRVHIGGSVTVEEGEVVEGDVVAIGGSARIDGEVEGDVVAVGGGVTLGPKASVARNVVVVGGVLRRDPSAHIGGKVQDVGIGSIDFERWSRSGSPFRLGRSSMFGSAFALLGTLVRLAILCLLASLVVLLGRDYMERAGTFAVTDPFKAGAIGLLAQLLFLPVLVITIVVLVITIIGIPLLILIPFLILGLAIVGLVGFTGVAYRLGRLLAERLGWSAQNPYMTTVAGILVLVSPLLLARLAGLASGVLFPFTIALTFVGVFAEYLAWTIGFGAVALAWFTRPRMPPPVPAT